MNRTMTNSQGMANLHATGFNRSNLAQRLVNTLRSRCSTWLHAPLERGLTHFNARLLALADDAANHFDQHNYLDTHQRLKCMREDFDRRFIASIDEAFQQLGATPEQPRESATPSLDLLDTTAHDRNAALDQLVARCTARGAMQMINLGYRFGVLLATPPLDSDQLPVGPRAMARAFGNACSLLDIPAAHELLLLQSLEGSLIDNLTSLYELIDIYLRDAGILPGLRPYALPHSKRSNDARNPTASGSGSRSPRAVPGQPSRHPQARASARTAHESASPSRDGIASDERLQAILASLQEHLLETDDQARLELNRPQRLREELSLLLNIGCAGNAPQVGLSRAQARTVDLIVRLFGEIAQKLPQNPDTHALLYDLHIPVLRVALLDPTFFQEHEHPARRVLNKVADISRDWLDEASGVPDHELRIELERMIDDACRSKPSTTMFVGLMRDIDQCLARRQLERQQAESQQVDVMRGLERLEKARMRTNELLVMHDASAGRTMRQSGQLQHAWSNVLALTMLRHGEDSAAFGKRLEVYDQLIGLQAMQDIHALRHDLDTGLRQIGMPADDRTRMIKAGLRIRRHARPAGEQKILPAHAAVEKAHGGETGTPATLAAEPSPEVLRIHRHLRNLPPGTWFEFLHPGGVAPLRRRLIWYSPLTGHSLFVTRNGQRAQELGELELALAVASGQIHEVEDRREDVIDQALHIAIHGSDPVREIHQQGTAS